MTILSVHYRYWPLLHGVGLNGGRPDAICPAAISGHFCHDDRPQCGNHGVASLDRIPH